MDKLEVLNLYKEQYANELERKDTISSNIQVRFAAIATALTILLYIVKNIDLDIPIELLSILSVLATIGLIFLGRSIYFLLDAYWENEFDFFPYADQVEEARQDMAKKGYFQANPDAFTEYLIDEFSSCAGQIAVTNDARQKKLRLMNRPFKIALFPFALVGLIFIFGDLDAASSRKDVSVSIHQPIECTVINNQLKE
ncbi:hypothetical protein ACSWLQ_001881 [Vibrio fluvialis]